MATTGSASSAADDFVVRVENLKTYFPTPEGVVKAVDGVSFEVTRGKTLCIVGESGSGKSVTARSVMQIVPKGRIVDGAVLFRHRDGTVVDLVKLPKNGRDIRRVRGRHIGLINQEPMSALSSLHTIRNQMTEAVRLHLSAGEEEADTRATDMLTRVGIPRPKDRLNAYSFELSGGMRQRVCIAMALMCGPELLIADEPTTALDVTTQANILDLIRELQDEMGMSVMFITHDLGVVAEIADEVVVMYLGQVCERGPADEIFRDPKHPYTRALLRSIPKLEFRGRRRLEQIRGIVPHPFNRPKGCPFSTRCDDYMRGVCDRAAPLVTELGSDREVRCFLYGDGQGGKHAE